MDVYREPDIISELIKVRLRWLGFKERMPEERAVMNIPEGKGSAGKPRQRRLDDVENDLKKMGVRGWRKIAGVETPGN